MTCWTASCCYSTPYAVHPSVFAVDDSTNCVSLIAELKYAEELVHAMKDLQGQEERQVAGLEALR